MTTEELVNYGQAGLVVLVVIIAGLIKIPKIEINFWTWLGKIIGKTLNTDLADEVKRFHKDTDEKIDNLAKGLDEHIKQQEQEKADYARTRFLIFNEELYANKYHTKEHFEEVLRNIDDYEDYCADHPLYENNKAELAIENIRRVYQQCVRDHTFLGPEN